MMPYPLVITCEHAGHTIPQAYRGLFDGQETLLESHRGWDRGALPLAQTLARTLDAPLHFSSVSRQLVDLNRTAARNLFSPISRALTATERERVLARHYRPYRDQVEAAIAEAAGGKTPVLHLSVHTFTPVLRGRRRTAECGLLYDPARRRETAFCVAWKKSLQQALPRWRVRRNYPYRGSDDGFTTYLRTRFGERNYLGIELEINQRLVYAAPAPTPSWFSALCASLKTVLQEP